MKFLKYFLAFIIIALLVFFGRGLMTSSVSYENQIMLDSSPETAWEVMSDESSMPEWIDGFKKIEHVSGTPNTVGAVSKIYVDNDGQEMTMTETITALEPNEKMSMNFAMDFMEMDYTIILDEAEGQTQLTTQTTVAGNGLFAKSMISWMSGGMKAQEDVNLGKLKAIVER